MTHFMTKDAFKRVAKDLADICPFYKATFTTQISRVRFNREMKRRYQRAHAHMHFLFC